jgi:hypothetical protein
MLRLLTFRRLVLSAICILHVLLPGAAVVADASSLPEAWQARVHIESHADKSHRGHLDQCILCQAAGQHFTAPARGHSLPVDLRSHSTAVEHRPIAPRQSMLRVHHSRAPPIS